MNINDGRVLASVRFAPAIHIGPGPGPRAVVGLVSGAMLAVRLCCEPQRPIAVCDVFNVLFVII